MAACTTTAFAVQGRAGRLFAVRFEPAAPRSARGSLLVVPPFAEEMNKSRRMLTLLAQRAAADGWRALHVDPYGTGDSEGDFSDARWEIWRDDLVDRITALRDAHPGPIVLCAMRLGALLALEALRRVDADVAQLVLWQPVLSGRLATTQFLRLKLASEAMGGGAGGSVDALRRTLDAGSALEVAGYALAGDLVRAIDACNFAASLPDRCPPIRWLEVASSPSATPPPATAAALATLRARGIDVAHATCEGPPFWTTAEIAVAPALLDATAAALQGPA